MSPRFLVLVLSLVAAAPALAQEARVIDPGMTRAQVISELGAPATIRTSGRFVYLLYPNGCERTCGMQDLVILEDDAVVDAIFRSARRAYSGTSSSPGTVAPGRTTRGGGAVRSSLGNQTGSGSIILARPAANDSVPQTPPTIRRAAGATTPGAPVPATPANPNPARAEQLLRAPHDSAVGTPQTPPLGSPVPRDSSYVPGVQLRPGEKPVPFQGARPSPADSARRAQAQARPPADTTPRPQE